MKEGNQITLGLSDSTATADFNYSMSGKVISITYLGTGSIHEESGRMLRRIEHWHQGPVTSYRILYQDAAGPGARSSGTARMRKLPAAMKNESRRAAGRVIFRNDRRRRRCVQEFGRGTPL